MNVKPDTCWPFPAKRLPALTTNTDSGDWKLSWSMAGVWLLSFGSRHTPRGASHHVELPREMEQEAKLIVAAPDLLDALHAVGAELIGPERPHSTDSYLPPHIVDQVRAAIAKAAGIQ